MLYDMDVTEKLIGRKPQLELDIIKSWQSNYANLDGIDQRLVNPDRGNDPKHGFDRTKVFAHGKAAFYLAKAREKLGQAVFDAAVKEYVAKCRDCVRGYEDFKKFLSPAALKTLVDLEKQYQVGGIR